MTKKELTIITPIGDWEKEYLHEEVDVSSEEAVIAVRLSGDVSPQQLGRFVIVARERKETEADIIPPNKVLLSTAASVETRRILTRRQEPVETPSGRTYGAPAFVGPVRTPDDEAEEVEPFVKLANQKAEERALGYLARAIPGHIWSRLLIVAAHGGDIVAAAQIVHDKIDEMVKRLMEPADK